METAEKSIDCTHVIHFEDNGQDFLRWYLDKEGYVIKSEPFQTRIWEGCQIPAFFIELGEPGELVPF